MAKEKQDKTNTNPKEAMKKLLISVVAPFEESLKEFQRTQLQISKNVQTNAKNIQTIANRPQEPAIPKEITNLIPDLLDGVIKIFTQPSTDPAAASKGIFGEKMKEAYEKSMITQWENNSLIQAENLKALQLENKLRDKRLTEEF